jgi:glycosyltransferase involved in cell wall biosynthesis
MACGCAVVTTDCGGVRSFARPGENCLMVPPADAVALARAIDELAGDAALRAGLAAAGVATARRYGREAVLDRFCRYVETLARDGRVAAGMRR